jgi:hypothetical protein
VVKGCVGISIFSPEQGPIGEQFFQQRDGRAQALIPLAGDLDAEKSVLVRSGEQPSSVVRVYRAELLCDPDLNSGKVAPIQLGH